MEKVILFVSGVIFHFIIFLFIPNGNRLQTCSAFETVCGCFIFQFQAIRLLLRFFSQIVMLSFVKYVNWLQKANQIAAKRNHLSTHSVRWLVMRRLMTNNRFRLTDLNFAKVKATVFTVALFLFLRNQAAPKNVRREFVCVYVVSRSFWESF